MQNLLRTLIALTLAAALAACSSGGNSDDAAPQSPPPPPPPPPPPGASSIGIERVFPQLVFQSPVAMRQAPGDTSRWFVVEQAGVIRVFDNAAGAQLSTAYLDIAAQVVSGGERGLLGLEFHPDFQNNGQLFVSYTAGNPLQSVISRFTLDSNTGLPDTNSEAIVLQLPQPQGNHNGGDIAFGPDGYLYVGFGDGGGGGDPGENGQNTGTLLGSMLRLDVDGAAPYAIPNDNPFAGNTQCSGGVPSQMGCPEIYAWGFRNPWRFSFDRQTGELWVGDVGQGDWEEIDRVTIGLNYGWDEREGAHCYEPASGCSTMNVDPITEYDHGVGFSVTGGYVYRGASFPTLNGQYLFGDFVTGRIWSVAADAPQGTDPTELIDTSLGISAFAQSPDGELYVVDYGGEIYQVVPPP